MMLTMFSVLIVRPFAQLDRQLTGPLNIRCRSKVQGLLPHLQSSEHFLSKTENKYKTCYHLSVVLKSYKTENVVTLSLETNFVMLLALNSVSK